MARPRNASFAGGGDDVKAFLRDLRDLRGQAGLKHGELARRAHFPEDTLKSAERGPDLPALPILEAYVRGCGASPAEWEDRWRRLTTGAALELSLPAREPSAVRRPGGVTGPAGPPAGAAPLAAPAAVPGPRIADQELASRVVAGLEAHSVATGPAQPLTAGPAQPPAYRPFVPQAPMGAPADRLPAASTGSPASTGSADDGGRSARPNQPFRRRPPHDGTGVCGGPGRSSFCWRPPSWSPRRPCGSPCRAPSPWFLCFRSAGSRSHWAVAPRCRSPRRRARASRRASRRRASRPRGRR